MTLAQGLLEAGLIQFGWFQRDGKMAPVALHLDMLASYPALLDQAAREAETILDGLNVNRLLCSADALPFGVAVSLRRSVPLVYSRGTSAPPVSDLVGAYDIGHPAILLTNAVGLLNTYAPLVSAARRVGLETHALLTILEIRHLSPPDGVTVVPLLRLDSVVYDLRRDGHLPAGHADAVLEWIGEAE